jgi:MoxR-like ATPase
MSNMKMVWEVVNIATQANVPVILWGEPGIGKTEIINQMAQAQGRHVETVIMSLRDPSDLGGLPIPTGSGETGQEVILAPPKWAVNATKAKKSMIFFDEFSTAMPSVQAAGLRVIAESCVGEFQMEGDIAMIAAANPPECAAGGWELEPPMANRFLHLDVTPDPASWVEWALSKDSTSTKNWKVLPDNWKDLYLEARSHIAAYIKKSPTALQMMPGGSDTTKGSDSTKASRAWASPRTWDMAAKMMAACRSIKADQEIEAMALGAAVGNENALNYLTWLRNLDIPDPETLIKNPKEIRNLKRADLVYVAMGSVCAAIQNNLTEERWNQGWEILSEMLNNPKQKDISIIFAAPLVNNRPNNMAGGFPASMKSFMDYANKHNLFGNRS